MKNRRSFLKQTLSAGAVLPVLTGCSTLSRRAVGGPLRVAVDELHTISRQPDSYHGWPTLARRRNGELLLVCSGGREAHVCPFGRVELMISRDEGRTWGDPRVILEGPIDDRDAGVLETRKGTLLATSFTSLAYEPILERAIQNGNWPAERLNRWRAVHERFPKTERDAMLGQWIIRSEDGGLSWSRRYPSIANSPHGPIQLADGRLLYAGKELWTGERRCGFSESRDDGRTWQWLATLPVREGDQMEEYHELHAVETKSGRVIAQIRNHNAHNSGETLQSESDDGGRTWTMPHSIGVWGLPSHLLRLRSGRLVMTYGYRRKPFGNQARVSDDEGATWSEPLTISDDGAGGDLGYPSTVELRDGSLLTVWYELPSGSSTAVLRQARWRIVT